MWFERGAIARVQKRREEIDIAKWSFQRHGLLTPIGLDGVDVKTGTPAWRYDHAKNVSNVATCAQGMILDPFRTNDFTI
jgi:hypothetical protein